MAGLWSWLFRRGKSRAVAELPRAVPSGRPTSVQIAKQLVARADTAAESVEAEPSVPVRDEPAPVAPDEPAPVAPDEPAPVAPDEPAPVAPDEPAPVAPDEPDTTEPQDREISPARLDQALRRLREEIPASAEGASSATQAEE